MSLYFKFVYYKKIKIKRNKNLSMYLKMLLRVFFIKKKYIDSKHFLCLLISLYQNYWKIYNKALITLGKTFIKHLNKQYLNTMENITCHRVIEIKS
jgi:hypothetical protein